MQTLQETLHKMIDLLPWREESEVLAAHASVDAHDYTGVESWQKWVESQSVNPGAEVTE